MQEGGGQHELPHRPVHPRPRVEHDVQAGRGKEAGHVQAPRQYRGQVPSG